MPSTYNDPASRQGRTDGKRPFPLHLRRKQLARLVVGRHNRLPDDGWTYVKVPAEHCPHGRNRREALMEWLELVCALIPTRRQADDILDRIPPRRWSADALGRLLKVTDFERATQRITTIGSYQTPKPMREKRRKEKRSLAEKARREARGAKPREQYLAEAKAKAELWKAAGFRCRRTWERHGKPVPQLSQVRGQHSYCSQGHGLATSAEELHREGLPPETDRACSPHGRPPKGAYIPQKPPVKHLCEEAWHDGVGLGIEQTNDLMVGRRGTRNCFAGLELAPQEPVS